MEGIGFRATLEAAQQRKGISSPRLSWAALAAPCCLAAEQLLYTLEFKNQGFHFKSVSYLTSAKLVHVRVHSSSSSLGFNISD